MNSVRVETEASPPGESRSDQKSQIARQAAQNHQLSQKLEDQVKKYAKLNELYNDLQVRSADAAQKAEATTKELEKEIERRVMGVE